MLNADDILNAKILIVDDQAANVQLLEQMLRNDGYRCVTSTRNPHEVYALHRDHHYDLILLDLQMPAMDGFQVMDGLKEINADGYLPVLVISAQPNHKLRALSAGAKDFIAKPFDLVEVKTRIRNMLEVRLLYKQVEHYSQEMETLALYDAMTGLPNRRLLMDRLSLSIAHAHRNRSTMAVLFLDLDKFKQINDSLGHGAGDTLLNLVAARLVALVRQEDTVARLGGDEFVIALWELTQVDDVAKLAAKVVQDLSKPYLIDGHEVHISASIGVGIYPIHGEDGETLMKRADTSMYEVKRMGKDDRHIPVRIDLPTILHV